LLLVLEAGLAGLAGLAGQAGTIESFFGVSFFFNLIFFLGEGWGKTTSIGSVCIVSSRNGARYTDWRGTV